MEGSSPPTPPSSPNWQEEEVTPCSIDKLSYNLYNLSKEEGKLIVTCVCVCVCVCVCCKEDDCHPICLNYLLFFYLTHFSSFLRCSDVEEEQEMNDGGWRGGGAGPSPSIHTLQENTDTWVQKWFIYVQTTSNKNKTKRKTNKIIYIHKTVFFLSWHSLKTIIILVKFI